MLLIVIATNTIVVGATGAQQRGLVAVTIRDSVLFYSVVIWMLVFHSVAEFRYMHLYRVDSIEVKTLFYR